VTHAERISFAFERFKPQLVFHAAAYKHVPMMELQATEAVSTTSSARSTSPAPPGPTGRASS
jgi:dTDP-4-dehydrorhamnose reductase